MVSSKYAALMIQVSSFFFFSSRRLHTRYWRDWSSDVCSSDLLSPLARVLTHPDDVVAFDHLRGLTTAVLHNPGRLRYRGAVLTGGGPVTDLGPLLGLLPMRDGTVLTQDCAGGGGTGPCVLTSRAATGAVRWKRTIQRQLELVRDTPSG